MYNGERVKGEDSMATIALYKDKLNGVSGYINNVVSSSNSLNTQLNSLKTTLQGVSSNTYDLQETVNNISSSTKTEKEKIQDLNNLNKKIDEFISIAVNRDNSAKEQINKKKDEFYTKYSYLKPNCEKSALERISEACASAWEWCKDNWESIVSIIIAVVVVVAIVVASVLTFGAAAVIAAGAVGALVGIGCQLVADTISFAITGDWDASWQEYVGSVLGGAVGGILTLTGNPTLACTVDASISSFVSSHLSNLTGGEKKSSLSILGDSLFSATLTFGLGKVLGKPVDKAKKWLSKTFSGVKPIKRLAGQGSYDAAFNMVVTKLKKGTATAFSFKTIRNGVVGGMTASYAENVIKGIMGGISELTNENSKEIDISIDYSKFSVFQQ